MKNKSSSFFYSLEILHSNKTAPILYWVLYCIATVQTFFTLHIEGTPLFFGLSRKIVSPQLVLSESGAFAYLAVMFGFQMVSAVLLLILTRRSTMSRSNTIQMFVKVLFWTALINYTINIEFVSVFEDESLKYISMAMSTVLFVYNSLLFNFTLNSKRTWGINQMFVIDLLRISCMWMNGSRVLIVIGILMFLLVSAMVCFFRPIHLLSRHNKFAQFTTALNILFATIILQRILTQTFSPQNVAIQIAVSLIAVYMIRGALEKYIYYCIRKLYQRKDNKADELQTDIAYTLEHFLFLSFLEQNFEQYYSQIKLYMLEHYKNCASLHQCKCKDIVRNHLISNGQVCFPAQKVYHQPSKATSLAQSTAVSPQLTSRDHNKYTAEIAQIKTVFSEFTLSLISNYLQDSLNLSEIKVNPERQIRKSTKPIQTLEKREILNRSLMLHYIKLQKLSSMTLKLTNAYLQLKSLEFQLKHNKMLSGFQAGILNSLKEIIVLKKQISMKTDTSHSNPFCIKYFHCQRISNKLEEVIVMAIQQIKLFWTQVKVKEPDENLILEILRNFNHYHSKIMKIYEQIIHGKQKQSYEVKIMLMFYGKILELQGENKFFVGHLLKEEKQNTSTNAVSNDIKMFSEESNTYVLSFSIEEPTFGSLKYTSSGVSAIFDPSFKKVSDFMPIQCESYHNNEIKSFLYSDKNNYKHSGNEACFIKIKPEVISPALLQVHLMAFLTIGEIEMITFFQPLIEQKKLVIAPQTQKNENENEDGLIVCCNHEGKILSRTKNFEAAKQRMFDFHGVEEVLTTDIIKRLQQEQNLQISLEDSDYQLILLKKIPTSSQSNSKFTSSQNQLFFIEFIDTLQNNMLKSQPMSHTQNLKLGNTLNSTYSSSNRQNKRNSVNVKQLLLKVFDNDLIEVHNLDSMKQKANKVWRLASKPQKNKFMLKMYVFVIVCAIIICCFMMAKTILIRLKKSQYIGYGSVIEGMIDMEIAMAQSITYLRQLNIRSYLNITENKDRNPAIFNALEQLANIIHSSMLNVVNYLSQGWLYVQVPNSKVRIILKEKGHVIINTIYLNSMTNVVENLRIDENLLNISPIQSQVPVPYSQPVLNYIKLYQNGVRTVVPELLLLRQKLLNKVFFPQILNFKSKPFVDVFITESLIFVVLFAYFVYKSRQMTKLAYESLRLFPKLKVSFADKKIRDISRVENDFSNNQITSSESISNTTKQIAWKKLTNIFSKRSSEVFSSFLINTIGTDYNQKIMVPKDKNNAPRSSIALTLMPPNSHEMTDRELFNKENQDLQRSMITLSCKSNRNNKQIEKNDKKDTLTKQTNDFIEFQFKPIIKKIFYGKAKFGYIILPMLFYFAHIFYIAFQYNDYMLSVLDMKTKLLNRDSNIQILTSYKYELGLFEYKRNIGQRLVRQIQKAYSGAKDINALQKKFGSFMFGSLKNYKKAQDTFMYQSICDRLETLGKPNPSYNIDFNKGQCETVLNGILKTGFKQSYHSFLIDMLTLTTEHYDPYLLKSYQRYIYLKDSRVTANTKLSPYIYMVSKYISEAFEKDIQQSLDAYDMLIIIDAPIMILVCFSSMLYFLFGRKAQADHELMIIKCSFLLIGNKSLIEDPTLLKEQNGKDEGERFYSLQ